MFPKRPRRSCCDGIRVPTWADHWKGRSLLFRIPRTHKIDPATQLLFSSGVPAFFSSARNAFDKHSQISQTRSFARLDETWGRHHRPRSQPEQQSRGRLLSTTSQATSLPSTRTDSSSRHSCWVSATRPWPATSAIHFSFRHIFNIRSEPSLLQAATQSQSCYYLVQSVQQFDHEPLDRRFWAKYGLRASVQRLSNKNISPPALTLTRSS